jgi:hypothetical protein
VPSRVAVACLGWVGLCLSRMMFLVCMALRCLLIGVWFCSGCSLDCLAAAWWYVELAGSDMSSAAGGGLVFGVTRLDQARMAGLLGMLCR